MALLDAVKNYKGLFALDDAELPILCEEIRRLIIDVTLKNGGHLGGSLGAVELCVALLRAFDPEVDRIIFDVGHQSYAYKILTDRLDVFPTLRTKGGMSGFPRRSESRYDAFDTGHSSTSISAALGFAKARDIMREKREVVAVIGDGALLNGLALEALNNVDAAKTKVTIVLNDNKMSIGARVGGLASHLARIAVCSPYMRLKRYLKDNISRMPNRARYEARLGGIKDKIKSMLQPPNIFEAMQISYWGPFDGHDVRELERIFEMSKKYPDPLLIHVITQKGRGYAEAEARPSVYHGVGAGAAKKSASIDWSSAVADEITRLASSDPRVIACTAAMEDGTKLSRFKERFPDRTFDVGIAEGHMLTFAAGAAAGGLRPVVCIYSTFLQRAMDNLVHDICMQHHPVLIAVDRSGLNGEDGETHQGLLDLAWGRAIPGLVVGAPRDLVDLEAMMRGWLERSIPMMIRYPKGEAPTSIARGEVAPWGSAQLLERGSRVCLVGLGAAVPLMIEAADRASERPTVVDLRWASPLDFSTIDDALASHDVVVAVEDGYADGGVGEAIAARAAEIGAWCEVMRVAVPAEYVAHAKRSEQMEEFGLTSENIASVIEEGLARAAARAAR